MAKVEIRRPYFEVNRNGYTRLVILWGRYAIKIPSTRKIYTRAGAGAFIRGLKSNRQESRYSKLGWVEICPVYFCFPWGLLLVMRRATPLLLEDWQNFDYVAFVQHDKLVRKVDKKQLEQIARVSVDPKDGLVPVECKQDSFGIVDNRIVAIDYGGFR